MKALKLLKFIPETIKMEVGLGYQPKTLFRSHGSVSDIQVSIPSRLFDSLGVEV